MKTIASRHYGKAIDLCTAEITDACNMHRCRLMHPTLRPGKDLLVFIESLIPPE